jgi:hypothetical protein
MHGVVMCGIPRSGSTLVWQIMRDVMPELDVLKTHPDVWYGDGSIVVPSIRDPRDVAASLLRVRLSRENRDEINDDDVFTVINRTSISFNRLKDIFVRPHTPILRYEQFYQNYDIIYDLIEDNLKVPVEPFMRKILTDRFNIKANKERADELGNFYDVDQDNIHGDHIGHIMPGYWVDYIPEEYHKLIDYWSKPLCQEWNYENI